MKFREKKGDKIHIYTAIALHTCHQKKSMVRTSHCTATIRYKMLNKKFFTPKKKNKKKRNVEINRNPLNKNGLCQYVPKHDKLFQKVEETTSKQRIQILLLFQCDFSCKGESNRCDGNVL